MIPVDNLERLTAHVTLRCIRATFIAAIRVNAVGVMYVTVVKKLSIRQLVHNGLEVSNGGVD